MKLIDADKGKMIIEITAKERSMMSALFSLISSIENPNWMDTEDGTGEPILNEDRFEQLWDEWLSLASGENAKYFFVGKNG